MPKHKFVSGDRVTLVPTPSNVQVRPGVYVIVRPMPVTSQGIQYRARNAADNHERVLDEAQLRGI